MNTLQQFFPKSSGKLVSFQSQEGEKTTAVSRNQAKKTPLFSEINLLIYKNF